MSNELVVLNNSTSLVTPANSGPGVDFTNPLFKLKASTVGIIQKNSEREGPRGSLYVGDTEDVFNEMWITLLKMPVEQRQYHIGGGEGQLHRTAENLMCFSRDMITPDPKAKVPQALKCAGCAHSNWDTWRDTHNKKDIPQCDAFYYALFIDTEYKMPLQMFFRSKARASFETAMGRLSKMLHMSMLKGNNPNVYDVKFRMTTKEITTGQFKSYIPVFDQFKYIGDEDRSAFGEVYQNFIHTEKNREQENAQAEAEAEQESVIQSESSKVSAAVTEGEYVEDEITI